MARERKYGWNGETPAKEQSGQALIVLRGMMEHKGEVHTGHEWADIIGPSLRTRQDPYRVVLYYILILKGKGCVRTEEFDINATTKVENVKHAITVHTESAVAEREVIVEPVVEEPKTETVAA